MQYSPQAIQAAETKARQISGMAARYNRNTRRFTLFSGNSGLNSSAIDVPPSSGWGRQFQAALDAEQVRLNSASSGGASSNRATAASALRVAGGALSTAGSLAGGAIVGGARLLASTGAAVVSGVAGGVMGAGGAVLSVVGQISSAVLSGLGALVGGVTRLLSGGLQVGLKILAGTVAALGVVIFKAAGATSTYGRSLRDLQGSGLSAGQAGTAQSSFGAVGLDAASMFSSENATAYGAKASLYGLPGYGQAGALTATAGRYQALQGQGFVGQMQARQMASSLGYSSPEALRALSTPAAELRKNQQFSQRTQAAFGLDPEKIVTTSRQFELLTQRVQVLGQTVLLAIGQRLLPVLTRWADGALNILESFSAQGSDVLGKGIDLLVSGVGRAFDGTVQLARFLSVDAPAAAYRFADSMLSGLETVNKSVPFLWDTFLHGIDVVQQLAGPSFDALAQTGASAFDLLIRGLNGAAAGISALVQELPNIQSGIKGVIAEIENSTLFQAAKTVLKIGGGVRENVRSGLENLGVDSGPASLVGALALPVALRVGAGLLAGGAGTGATGGGLLGGAARLAVGNPIVAGTAAGMGAIAYGGYRALNAIGAVDQENEGFWGWNRRMFGRVSSAITTGDANNYNGFEAERGSAELFARMNSGRVRGGTADASALGRAFDNIGAAASNAYNAPGAGDLSNLLGNLKGGAANLWNNAPSGTWSAGLNDRFGGQISEMQKSASEELERLHKSLRENFGEYADKDAAGQKWDEQLRALKEIAGNTRDNKNTQQELVRLLSGPTWRSVVESVMKSLGTNETLNLIQTR